MTSGPWRVRVLKERGGVKVGGGEVGTSGAGGAAMEDGD